MDEKTRRYILKGVLLVTAGTLFTTSAMIKYLMWENKQWRKKCDLGAKIVNRFMEVAPPDVTNEVIGQFEFDLIVLNVDL